MKASFINGYLFVFIIILMVSVHTLPLKAQTIIPEPVSMETRWGNFRFRGDINLFFPGGSDAMLQNARFLRSHLENIPDTDIHIRQYSIGEELPSNGIVLTMNPSNQKPEGYTIHVTSNQILITGNDEAGVFYGIQSLRQLLPPELEDPQKATETGTVRISNMTINDYPRFSYRGMHLDVARHFFDVDFIKRYLDLMALHKMNTFHWHLTEDQGWRIEIKKYPMLTEVGAWRDETLIGHGGRPPFEYDGEPHGGYYTQDEIREVVEYAKQHHITVIPEIEMPGHATAALASYPELGCTGGPYEVETRWGIFEDAFCAGNEFTFEFLENVLSEVVELFPSEYIHIGGDECLKDRWEECPKCQARIEEEGLKDEEELQSYFIQRIEKFLLSKNRKIIGWDEIMQGGLAPEATVMSWRGMEGGIQAAQKGHDVIMTPTSHCYFDYYQDDPETQPLAIGGYLTLRQVYSFNPIPEVLNDDEAKHILGGQGNVWTEYMKTPEHVEYMAYPRAVALAEVLWTPREKQDLEDFYQRLSDHFKRFDLLGVNYFYPWD